MSLDKVAQHLAAQGRGSDSVLVHMSPKEVGALQHMAKQHGGSLSINPQTGLPEAGFLDAILPVVAGAGLSLIPGVGPLMAAGIVGGGTALLTKDLNKGLMAGLGAFGGAGLAGGIMNAGASAALGSAVEAGAGPMLSAETLAANADAGLAGVGANAGQTTAQAAKAFDIANPVADPSAWDKMQAGFKNTNFDTSYLKNNMLPIGAALAPALMGGGNLFGGNPAQQQQTANAGYIRPYTYSQVRNPNYTGAGTPYFNQTMTAGTPIPSGDYGSQLMPMAAEGGIMSTRRMAEGGIADAPIYYDTTKYAGVPASAVDATNSGIAQLAPPTYNPVTRQYVAATPVAPVAAPMAPAPMIETYHNVDGGGGSGDDGGGTTGPGEGAGGEGGEGGEGEANGGLMRSYAMGGGIGGNYTGFNEQNNAIDGNAQFNQGPQYPMQQPQNFAPGGITNSRQAAVQSYVAAAQKSPEAMKQLQAKAQGGDYDAMIALNTLQGTPNQNYAAGGGIYDLGSYSDGGRLLKGPGDGVSDDIPAQIGDKQPARLADGEFVVPARIVSELGNGSTDAGAKRLYAMMERVQSGRKKSVGKDKVAVDSKAYKHLPA